MEVAASSFFRLCIPTNCSLLLLPGRGSQPYQRHRQSRGAAKCIRTISSGSGSCSGEVVGGDSDDLRCEGSRRLWKVWEEWEEWKLLRRSGGSRRRERGRCKVCRAVEPDVLSVFSLSLSLFSSQPTYMYLGTSSYLRLSDSLQLLPSNVCHHHQTLNINETLRFTDKAFFHLRTARTVSPYSCSTRTPTPTRTFSPSHSHFHALQTRDGPGFCT